MTSPKQPKVLQSDRWASPAAKRWLKRQKARAARRSAKDDVPTKAYRGYYS